MSSLSFLSPSSSDAEQAQPVQADNTAQVASVVKLADAAAQLQAEAVQDGPPLPSDKPRAPQADLAKLAEIRRQRADAEEQMLELGQKVSTADTMLTAGLWPPTQRNSAMLDDLKNELALHRWRVSTFDTQAHKLLLDAGVRPLPADPFVLLNAQPTQQGQASAEEPAADEKLPTLYSVGGQKLGSAGALLELRRRLRKAEASGKSADEIDQLKRWIVISEKRVEKFLATSGMSRDEVFPWDKLGGIPTEDEVHQRSRP